MNKATLAPSAPIGAWEVEVSANGTLEHGSAHAWTEELHRIFETTAAPTHGWLLARLLPDDRDALTAALTHSLATRSPGALEHPLHFPDGRTKFLDQRWQVLAPEPGRRLRVLGTCREITDQRQAELNRVASEALLRIAGQACLIGGWLIDLQTRALHWSDEVCAIHDLPVGQVPALDQGLSWFPAEHRGQILAAMTACERDGTPYDLELPKLTATGRSIWVRTIGEAVRDEHGKIIALQGAIQDITARKQAELELAATNRALQMTSRCREALIRTEHEPQLLEQICQICVDVGGYRMAWVGYAIDDARKSVRPMAHAGHELGYLSTVEITWDGEAWSGKGPAGRTIRSGAPTQSPHIKADPDFRWSEEAFTRGYRSVLCLPLRDGARTFGILALLGGEVREAPPEELARLQRLADDLAFGLRAIRARAEQHRTHRLLAQQAALLDQATDAIFVFDLALGITFWNRGAERLYGWEAQEVLGKTPTELLHSGDDELVREAMSRVLAEGAWSGEFQTRTRAGLRLTVAARWTLLRDELGAPKALLTINSDITETKRLEAQFLRAQRMQSIGTLAGGIAHDLNNMLAPILMSVDALQDLARTQEDTDILETVDASARRAADLVRQLLTFARGAEGARASVDPHALLEGIQAFIRDTFPKSISTSVRARPGLWPVLGDSTQLHQVLMNLCVNARDAMPTGGPLTLEVDNHRIEDGPPRPHETPPGNWVRFQVRDAGVGITPECKERIFEPFFTTKEVGKGTGLGLSTSLSIVKSHGGFIALDTQVGQGTTFTVYLPALATDAQPAAPTEEPAAPAPGTGQLVLVVDDERGVRNVVSRMLERAGYPVVQAFDGADALVRYHEHRGRLALVLTDLSMPNLNGFDLAEALKALDPSIRIVCTSGHASNEDVARLNRAGVTQVLHKPYSTEQLLDTVQVALAGASGK